MGKRFSALGAQKKGETHSKIETSGHVGRKLWKRHRRLRVTIQKAKRFEEKLKSKTRLVWWV